MKKLRHSPTAACPCRIEEGGNTNYADCCSPFHNGLLLGPFAPTPETLMRSRYSAYALSLLDYVLATWHPSTAPGDLEVPPIKWLGLKVLHAQATPDAGVVEFVARFKENGKAGQLAETSRFVREAGRWYYVDGQVYDGAA
jgi:SEC-C motif domain protein